MLADVEVSTNEYTDNRKKWRARICGSAIPFVPVGADIGRELSAYFLTQAQSNLRIRQARSSIRIVLAAGIDLEFRGQNQSLRKQNLVFSLQPETGPTCVWREDGIPVRDLPIEWAFLSAHLL
jgi:hypothetical protein